MADIGRFLPRTSDGSFDYDSPFETPMILGKLADGWILPSWNGELLRDWD